MNLNRTFVAAFVLLAGSVLHASTISFTGTFSSDDENVLFYYIVQNQGHVDVTTTSFASGGFMPVLSLFDSTGLFVYSGTGYATNEDATLGWESDAGALYIIALTQYANVPLQTTGYLSDGFTMDGMGNFTSSPGFPGPFRLDTEQRTGDWAINFSSAEPLVADQVPEPGTLVLTLFGGVLFAWWRRRRLSPRDLHRVNSI